MSDDASIRDVDNSLPSWTSDHLGEHSYTDTEVTEYPSYPKEDSPGNEGDFLVDTKPPPQRETNIMTQDKLERLCDSCSFPVGIQMRLSKANETVMFTRPGEVAFYGLA